MTPYRNSSADLEGTEKVLSVNAFHEVGQRLTIALKGAEMPGGPELLIILAVVLLLFGSTKVPQLARSLGQASREFKQGTHDEEPDRARAS